MTEPELRALVRDAVARELAHAAGPGGSAEPARARTETPALALPLTHLRQHASHALFTLDSDAGGACIIEPAVACTHCGFCQSYGH